MEEDTQGKRNAGAGSMRNTCILRDEYQYEIKDALLVCVQEGVYQEHPEGRSHIKTLLCYFIQS